MPKWRGDLNKVTSKHWRPKNKDEPYLEQNPVIEVNEDGAGPRKKRRKNPPRTSSLLQRSQRNPNEGPGRVIGVIQQLNRKLRKATRAKACKMAGGHEVNENNHRDAFSKSMFSKQRWIFRKHVTGSMKKLLNELCNYHELECMIAQHAKLHVEVAQGPKYGRYTNSSAVREMRCLKNNIDGFVGHTYPHGALGVADIKTVAELQFDQHVWIIVDYLYEMETIRKKVGKKFNVLHCVKDNELDPSCCERGPVQVNSLNFFIRLLDLPKTLIANILWDPIVLRVLFEASTSIQMMIVVFLYETVTDFHPSEFDVKSVLASGKVDFLRNKEVIATVTRFLNNMLQSWWRVA